MFKRHLMIGSMLILSTSASMSATINVGTVSALVSALGTQNNGNEIVLAPGEYNLGGRQLSAVGLSGITIRSADSYNPAILTGGQNIHLIKPENVTMTDLIIQNMTQGGLNIDDGGESPWTSDLAHDITLQNIVIRSIGDGSGNYDGIKLSGVNAFTIDNVQVIEWGGGGSGIDMVGCHNGSIKNSLFRSRQVAWTTGMVAKGGSKGISIDNNRFELQNEGVAVKLGGSTENQFFRFWPGESGYEAKDITVSNNTIIHSRAAVSYVNISAGGLVENNLIYQTGTKIARILDEASSEGNGFETGNGIFRENTVIFNNQLVRNNPVNVGDNTSPDTFNFSSNKWFNTDEPAGNNANGQALTHMPGTVSGNFFGVDPQACGKLELPSGQWRQISLPCEPQGNNAKIFALFADDIGDGTNPPFENYGTLWVVYRYNATEGKYEKMEYGDEFLNQGEGYWIIQMTGSTKELSMPADSLPIADGGDPGCLPLQQGCFNIPLITQPNKVQWNMIGYPYKISQPLNNIWVVSNGTPCASPGCDLNAAEANNIVHNELWTFEGSGYKKLGTRDGELDPWTGYWSPTLINAYGKSPGLRLQRP